MLDNDSIVKADQNLLQIIDSSLTDAAQRAGHHLYCHPGCTQCCHGVFAINALDALRLRTAMTSLTATDPALSGRIRGRAESYLTKFGPAFPGDLNTGILGTSEEAQQAFDEFANEAPCPALNPENGLCDLYDARPVACRVFGPPVRLNSEVGQAENSLDPDSTAQADHNEVPELDFAVCELCFTDATPEEVEAAEMHVPRDQEQQLLEDLAREARAGEHVTDEHLSRGETIVAFCLAQLPA